MSHPVLIVVTMAEHHHRTHRHHSHSHARARAAPGARLAAMALAVELEVDGEEFGLQSAAERALWSDLVAEFEERVAREGRSWVPELLG